MTVQKVCTSTFDPLGTGGCIKGNPFLAPMGINLTTAGFSFATMASASAEADWETGIQAESIFPLGRLYSVEDISVEATYSESDTQQRKLTRQGQYRYRYAFNMPLDTLKALRTYNNGDLRLLPYDEEDNIMGTRVGDTFKGFSTSMVAVEKMAGATATADAPALTYMVVDLADEKEWNESGDYVNPTWHPLTLKQATTVSLETSGVPTTSEVIINVYTTNPTKSSAGAIQKIGVSGIIEADFGTLGIGTAVSMTDNGVGTYTFASSAAFSTGDINLVSMALQASPFDAFYPKSDGAVTVTI